MCGQQGAISRDEEGVWDAFSVDDLVNASAPEHRDELADIVVDAQVLFYQMVGSLDHTLATLIRHALM